MTRSNAMTDTVPDAPPPTRDGLVRWYDLPIAFVGGYLLGIVTVLVLGVAGLFAVTFATHTSLSRPSLLALQTDFWVNHAVLIVSDLGFLGGCWFVARRRFARPVGQFFPPAAAATVLLAALSGVLLSLALNGGNELLSRAHLVT